MFGCLQVFCYLGIHFSTNAYSLQIPSQVGLFGVGYYLHVYSQVVVVCELADLDQTDPFLCLCLIELRTCFTQFEFDTSPMIVCGLIWFSLFVLGENEVAKVNGNGLDEVEEKVGLVIWQCLQIVIVMLNKRNLKE